MEITLPHNVVYELAEPASVADVVEALLGTEQLLRETAPMLEGLIPGLTIERIQISVRSISQGSPLRQALYVALFAVFQKDLEKAVPAIADKLLGAPISPEYNTVLTLVFCLLLFYGAESIYAQVNKKAHSKRLREQFNSIAKELSSESGLSEERIKNILEKRYGKSRLTVLAQSAISFFKPSKTQNDSAITIGPRVIGGNIVSEVPTDAQIVGSDVAEIARPFKDVLIQLHAQDVDRNKQGWAAVVPEISPKRLRMEIDPPINPNQIYTKSQIRGDVMLISHRRADGTFHPQRIHLLDIKD